MRKLLLASCLLLCIASLANATVVNVKVTGVVDYNVIGGGMTGTQSGTPTTVSFNVDSNNFVDSGSFPTRGYVIDLNSFSMTVGAVPVPVVIPQPDGTPYFVMRNNDPAVDGFFISQGNVDFPFALAVTIPGLVPQHELDCQVSYDTGAMWTSLDIMDALGTYDQSHLASYYWAIGRFGNPGAEYVYQTITLSTVPEPATALFFLPCAMLVTRRRK